MATNQSGIKPITFLKYGTLDIDLP